MGLLARYRSERTCPRCGSHEVARSRQNGFSRIVLQYVVRLRAYRCLECYRRYYGYAGAHRLEQIHHDKAA